MKIIRITLCVLLCAGMLVNINGADSDNVVIFEYENDNMTVIFDQTEFDDAELCKIIADYLVYGAGEYDITPTSISWCWLFGHDITTSTVTTITHKVRSTSPRCLREIHNVDTCSKCDYLDDEVVSSVYIVCHPND